VCHICVSVCVWTWTLMLSTGWFNWRRQQQCQHTANVCMYVYRNTEGRSRNHCYSGKPLCITYRECVFVALGIQHEMRMRHIVCCGLARSKILSHILWWTARFKKKKVLNTKCVFWFSVQLLSETFLILRRTERDMIKIVYRSAWKVPVIVGRL
jgi:hypothetical protein